MSARAEVLRQVERMAGRPVRGDEALIDDLGLRSLELAQLVATLEISLDVLPFVEHFAVTDLRTVDDLAHAFASLASPEAP